MLTERHTRGGDVFTTACAPRDARATWLRIGVKLELDRAGVGIDRLKTELDIHLVRNSSGTIVRTGEADTLKRFRRLNQPEPAPQRP